MKRQVIMAVCTSFAMFAPVRADDWPQWLGPQRDGIWRETGLLEKFPADGAKVRWRTAIGGGYAGPAVADGRVYVGISGLGEEVAATTPPYDCCGFRGSMLALDVATGAVLWKHYTVPEHFAGGWKGASSERQPPMYFRLGGGTLKGVSKPGSIVWSRVYVADGRLKCDLGLGEVVALPEAETEERWQKTTPQWPIMHAALKGVSRDQMMARHPSNHIQVVYAPDEASAKRGLFAKAAAMKDLGLEVFICGALS